MLINISHLLRPVMGFLLINKAVMAIGRPIKHGWALGGFENMVDGKVFLHILNLHRKKTGFMLMLTWSRNGIIYNTQDCI